MSSAVVSTSAAHGRPFVFEVEEAAEAARGRRNELSPGAFIRTRTF